VRKKEKRERTYSHVRKRSCI